MIKKFLAGAIQQEQGETEGSHAWIVRAAVEEIGKKYGGKGMCE